jgi:hypothetical protein
MVRITKRRLVNFLLLMFIFLVPECANQLPPEGGEVDKIPPEIIEVYPEDGSINFNDDYFEIGFSEYVDRRSVKDAIFISPAIEGELELDWSGKYVRIEFPDTLKQNKTYVVTIGTDVADFNNGNKMAEAFNFTFSTGPEIDRRVVSGKIYDDEPQGIMLFGYQLKAEEFNLLENKPDYISQAGADGKYKLAGLAAGLYRIFAVKDEYRDLLFQPEQDAIGIPYRDVKLDDADTLFAGLDFFMTKVDTMQPRLLSASMTDRNHVLVNFSEELEKGSLSTLNFYLLDSTENKKVQIKYSFKGNTKPTEIVLVPNEIINTKSIVYLFADTLMDKSDNAYILDFVEVTLSDRIDTLRCELYNSTPQEGSKEVDFLNPKISFEFNDAFDVLGAKDGIVLSDTLGKKVPFEIEFPDDASFIITPSKRLDMSKDYIIKIDLSRLKDFAGNSIDSIYEYTFKTIAGLDFTGVSGKVIGADSTKTLKLDLKNVEREKLQYETLPNKIGQFNFERIIPGKYLLFGYYDSDSSKTYSFGSVMPFKQSEEFSFYPDTLNLRARWTETDVKFLFTPK